MSEQDPVTKALQALGVDPTQVDAEVLESLRDAAKDAIPPEQHVQRILEAEAQGEPVLDSVFLDAQAVGVPHRMLKNAAFAVRQIYRSRGDQAAAAVAAEVGAEILAEMDGSVEHDPESPTALAADVAGWNYR